MLAALGVADPGAVMVKRAHQKGYLVKPLVGPSSILLALMASGMNGQSFAFNGYLPIEKKNEFVPSSNLKNVREEFDQTQLFIETPYRNEQFLQDLLRTLAPTTLLCVACDLTLPTEWIYTAPVKAWKNMELKMQKKTCNLSVL